MDTQIPVYGPKPQLTTVEMQVKHLQCQGLYVRANKAPQGAKVATKVLSQEHMEIIATGEAIVVYQGKQIHLVGPAHFIVPAEETVEVYLVTDCIWYSLFPTVEQDIDRLKEDY